MPFLRHGPTFALLAMLLLASAHVGVILMRDYAHFLDVMQDHVRQPAVGFAAATETYFARYQAALEVMAEAPCVRAQGDCGSMFGDLKQRFASAVNFAALDRNGSFFASSIGLPAGHKPSVAMAGFFLALKEGGKDNYVMDPHVGPISAERVTGLIIPLRDAQGGFDGAIGVSLRFSELLAIWRSVRPASGVGVAVLDRHGAVMFAESGGRPQDMPPAEALDEAIRQQQSFGTVSSAGQTWHFHREHLPHQGWTIVAVRARGLGVSEYLVESTLPASLLPPTLALAVLGGLLTWRNWRHVGHLEARVFERTSELTISNLELAESNRKLREINQELETFVWVASHDLREPLRAVATHVTLLERRHAAVLDDDARNLVAVARGAAKRLDRLVLDLLEYASVGRSKAPMQPVDLGTMMHRLSRRHAGLIEQTRARLVLAPDLPVVAAREADIDRLYDGLISNALTHRDPGRAPLIEIGAQRDGGDWRLWVADNGPGIEPVYHEKIFVLFQRLRPAEHPDGTGAGLTICRKIVRHYGGDISLQSEPGRGSRFVFSLPGWPPQS